MDDNSKTNQANYFAISLDDIIRDTTDEYLDSLDIDNPPEPKIIRFELLQTIRNNVELYNVSITKSKKIPCPRQLTESQIAHIILRLYPIVNIDFSGNADEESEDKDFDATVLAIYDKDTGLYSTSTKTFYRLIEQYRYNLRDYDFKEILAIMSKKAPVRGRCSEPNLSIVNNGIFDYKTKQLMPFSPDYIFTSKTSVNYNPNATNVVIHNPNDGTDWDVESWMDSISDNPEIVKLLWEVIGATVRPNYPWDKVIFLCSEIGCNAKGTFLQLLKMLSGKGNYCSLSITDFNKDFLLEPLLSVSTVLSDESDTAGYLDDASTFKSIVTGDSIIINRKFKTPITFASRLFMVFCLNGIMHVRDTSDSLYRRLLPIPMNKQFLGIERKYIKHDYLKRSEVLEYVLYKALNSNCYELSMPQECKDLLQEFKIDNNPVQSFAECFFGQNVFQWDLLPSSFLYALFKAWYEKNYPSGKLKSSHVFYRELIKIINDGDYDFVCENKDKQYRPGNMMDNPEWLIEEYNLQDWKNPLYKGADKAKICTPSLKVHYRGLIRKGA